MNQRGFSTVEIMMTLAVIALLLAIGIPSYRGYVSRARGAACAGHLRNLSVGLNGYLTDHNFKMPTMVLGRESKDDDQPALDTVLADYVSGEQFFRCPGDRMGIYEKTGTSYFWNQLLNGQNFNSLKFFMKQGDTGIPIAGDKEKFHPGLGDEVNILYADGHVTKDLRFFVP